MDGGYRLQSYPDHEDVGLILPQQPVRAVAGDGGIIDMVAREQHACGRARSGDGMRGMNAARDRVACTEDLGQHARMGGRFQLIPVGVLRRHRAPGHRRHEQVAVAHVVKQCLDDRLGAKAAPAQRRDGAMDDQSAVARDADALQDRQEGGRFLLATEPAAITAPSPMLTPAMTLTLCPVHTSLPTVTCLNMSGVRSSRTSSLYCSTQSNEFG